MDTAEDLRYLPEARTPEPQRFNSHTLGCYPSTTDPARVAAHDSGIGRVSTLEHAEDEYDGDGPPGYRVNALADCGQHNNTDGPHTPPTVSRHSWLQLHRRDDGLFGSVGAPPLHPHGGEAFFQPSPTSFAPSGDGNTERYGARSASFPIANRSVAPARYSVEFNVVGGSAGGSGGRHTTLLGGVGLNGSGLQDPLGARPSAPISAAAAAFTVVRPTILMPTSTSPFRRSREHSAANNFTPHGGKARSRYSDSYVDHHNTPSTHPLPARAHREASRPHLSRFSGGSSGEGRSPGVNAGIGRPTTLRYPDADLGGVYQQWCDDGDNELWMGGVTQVWRSSTELSGPAVVTQHCAFATASLQDEEETVAVPALQHPSTGGLSGQQGFSPSPTTRCQHPMWVCSASHVDACGQSDHAVLWSEEATNAERAKAHNEDTQPNCLPSAVKNASLTGLEDAPRKSYVRSTVNSPTRGDAERDVNAGAPAHSENTACGGKEDCGCVPAGDTVLTKPHYRPGVTLAISTEAVPFSSNAKQQRDWLYEDESVAVERKTRGDMTPQGRPFVSRVQPAVTGSNTADTAAAAADAVVAQLARLSIQASPTQKRLAFEEEEEDEDVLEGSSTSPGSSNAPTRSATNAAAGESIATANCGRWGSAFRPLSAGRGRGAHAAHCGHAAANRWSSGGRVASLSGLQLLRSRKRCLEEMESSDTGASAPCTPVNSTARPTGTTNFVDDAGCSDADAVKRSVSQDGWKRQKREEQRYQRQQRLLPGEGNAEDLIPAPMRAGAAASVCSSASFRALQLNAGSQEVGPPPQPLLVHGDATNWSQLSSITYVTPASQSCSTGMMGILSYSSLSQREGCPDAGNNAPAACSQVLSPLPTNVTRRYPNMKH